MDYYNAIAHGYEELHGEEQLKKLNLIVKHLKPEKSDLLLDVGCGTGLTTRFWGCKRTGIDPAEKLLKKAREKDREGTYIRAPAEKIPFPKKSFDIVISITALQNFNDIEKGLDEIKRVAKQHIVLSVLKRAKSIDAIKALILKKFKITRVIDEEKDLIFIGKI